MENIVISKLILKWGSDWNLRVVCESFSGGIWYWKTLMCEFDFKGDDFLYGLLLKYGCYLNVNKMIRNDCNNKKRWKNLYGKVYRFEEFNRFIDFSKFKCDFGMLLNYGICNFELVKKIVKFFDLRVDYRVLDECKLKKLKYVWFNEWEFRSMDYYEFYGYLIMKSIDFIFEIIGLKCGEPSGEWFDNVKCVFSVFKRGIIKIDGILHCGGYEMAFCSFNENDFFSMISCNDFSSDKICVRCYKIDDMMNKCEELNKK